MDDASSFRPLILLTGFASGPGAPANVSGSLLPLVASNAPARAELRTQLLPMDPEGALLKAVEAMDRLLPDAVIGLGSSEEIPGPRVERVAVNLDDCGADGRPSRGEPIDAAGPTAYLSTLPTHLIVERMQSGGVSAVLSSSAGTGIDNRLFYALLHYVALRGQETWFKRRPPAGLASRVGYIRLRAVAPGAHTTRARNPRSLDLEGALLGVMLAIEAVVDFLATPDARTAELSPASD